MGDAEHAWPLYPLGNYTKKTIKFNLHPTSIAKIYTTKANEKSSICSVYLSFSQSFQNIWNTGIVFPFFYLCVHVQAQKTQPLSTMKEWKISVLI